MSGAETPPTPGGISQALSVTRGLSTAGLLFIYLSLVCFLFLGVRITISTLEGQGVLPLEGYIPEIIILTSGVFTAFVGVGLVRSAGHAASNPRQVINMDEWETVKLAVKDGNEDAITQYVRLTSLSGVTGFFTKLGLQGLPLATIGLTIFFSLLYIKDTQYLDLAKLTLGAFIGSFVQKQVGASQPAGKVQLPTGETIRVTPTAPSSNV